MVGIEPQTAITKKMIIVGNQRCQKNLVWSRWWAIHDCKLLRVRRGTRRIPLRHPSIAPTASLMADIGISA